MTGNDNVKSQGDSLVRRFCLRLDNGTRIGYGSSKETTDKVVKLEFAEGFKEGVVSEEDLYRISDIAGQLDARREAASRPKPAKEVSYADIMLKFINISIVHHVCTSSSEHCRQCWLRLLPSSRQWRADSHTTQQCGCQVPLFPLRILLVPDLV